MTNQMIAYEETRSQMLMPVANLMIIKEVYQAKKEFVTSILKKGVDFGNVPGSDKPTLLKPGAEKMTSFFGLAPTFDDIEKVEDWTGDNHSGEPFFYYRLRCSLWRNVNGVRVLVASADGSCNSWEKKYRYRKNNRKCPACGSESIIKGKAEYGGGWLCFKNKGGCGAKFRDGDQSIEAQETGQIKNPDVAEQVNTILKMAQKRALIAATLIATGTSEYFTQDIEDFTNTTEHIDAEFVAVDEAPMVEPEPDPEPVKPVSAPKKVERPMAPEKLREMLQKKAASYGECTVNQKQIGLLASMIEVCFAGVDNPDKIRHSVVRYLAGTDSLKDVQPAMVKAMLDFLKPVQDSGGAYAPDEMAVKEIKSVWTAALQEAGQESLPLE